MSDATGPLATEQPLQGTSDLIFSATDPGAGVYQAVFTVDGKVVQTLDHRRKQRALPKHGTDSRRTAAVSLPAALSEIGYGGRGLRHDRRQQWHPSPDRTVSDAAGNTATVLDRTIIVQNELAGIGPATYRFRAQLPHAIGYPFASGASRSSYIHLTQ